MSTSKYLSASALTSMLLRAQAELATERAARGEEVSRMRDLIQTQDKEISRLRGRLESVSLIASRQHEELTKSQSTIRALVDSGKEISTLLLDTVTSYVSE